MLAFTLRSRDRRGVVPDEVRVTVDSDDVTARCHVRLAAMHPPSRADYTYVPNTGWRAGRHDVRVEWPGRMADARWSFDVG
jgi:hypothetical protein